MLRFFYILHPLAQVWIEFLFLATLMIFLIIRLNRCILNTCGRVPFTKFAAKDFNPLPPHATAGTPNAL